jgi:hypothetical protein
MYWNEVRSALAGQRRTPHKKFFDLLTESRSLAYAELFLTTAAIFRRYDMELFDTTIDDIKVKHDFFAAAPAQPARGIKVRIV